MDIYKINKSAQLPAFATEGSACFDLRACFEKDTKIRCFNPHNKESNLPVRTNAADGRLYLMIQPQFRTLVPTGLIFDIPEGFVLKVYPRSGMALKNGLTLANSVGIIDSDYVEETFVMIYNLGDTPIQLYNEDRIAQASLEAQLYYDLSERDSAPEKKTNRNGGLGSTGV